MAMPYFTPYHQVTAYNGRFQQTKSDEDDSDDDSIVVDAADEPQEKV